MKPHQRPRLAGRPDCDDLRDRFGVDRRVRLGEFLDKDAARRVREALLALDWRLVLNEGRKHFDIPRSHIRLLGEQKMQEILATVRARAQSEFQYLYENYPIADLLNDGHDIEPVLEEIFRIFNERDTLDLIELVTGEGVEFCDMQATRYRHGHFLTAHDDDVAGKNRKLGYVLNLSRGWKPEWGGGLEFLSPGGGVVETFSPQFNALSLFKVPVNHRVSVVAASATSPRIALTGWFRTR